MNSGFQAERFIVMQMFPSDQYTYNLQRIGSASVFTVTFDLTKEVEVPDAPWGWEEQRP